MPRVPTTGWPRANFRNTIVRCTGNRPRWSDSESFAARARKLVTRGFKPKDAAQITLQEITFENRNDPSAAKKAQADAEDFLRRVKDGLI